jgi:hypothetical protein
MINGKAVTARFSESEYKRFDDWRRAQPIIPKVAEAVRTLILRQLSAEEIGKRRVTRARRGAVNEDE